ncbi:hypothetical protein JCM10213_008222 [Rhodosporidiobolus nylandii]
MTAFASIARTTALRAAVRPQPLAAAAAVRGFAVSTAARKDSGEGVGEKKSINADSNPVTARLKGVGEAAKSVAEGVMGMGEAAAGKDANERNHHPGPEARSTLEAEVQRGKEAGLKKKGEEQGGL